MVASSPSPGLTCSCLFKEGQGCAYRVALGAAPTYQGLLGGECVGLRIFTDTEFQRFFVVWLRTALAPDPMSYPWLPG